MIREGASRNQQLSPVFFWRNRRPKQLLFAVFWFKTGSYGGNPSSSKQAYFLDFHRKSQSYLNKRVEQKAFWGVPRCSKVRPENLRPHLSNIIKSWFKDVVSNFLVPPRNISNFSPTGEKSRVLVSFRVYPREFQKVQNHLPRNFLLKLRCYSVLLTKSITPLQNHRCKSLT